MPARPNSRSASGCVLKQIQEPDVLDVTVSSSGIRACVAAPDHVLAGGPNARRERNLEERRSGKRRRGGRPAYRWTNDILRGVNVRRLQDLRRTRSSALAEIQASASNAQLCLLRKRGTGQFARNRNVPITHVTWTEQFQMSLTCRPTPSSPKPASRR